ncbi:MAG: geranylgeranyl reductase family protein, partial [Candidatus Lokiarchaeota archaeon]|nr:geranylgeranyl reductase family protein [Candidatus Lokiarchaeota archaeon]
MKTFDVIISGAGPSGSRCAKILAEQGYKVALLEKNVNWRKPCGGAVSARIMSKYYPQLNETDPHILNGAIMFSADYNKLEYNWEKEATDSIVVDRLEFDNYIRNIAVENGAELFDQNISFDFVMKDERIVGIKTKTPSGIKQYKGKIIIIADGMSSKLAVKSKLRDRWNIKDLGLAKCSILEGNNRLHKNKMYLYFRPYKGYGWIFPLSKTKFNIGCGTFAEDNLKYNLNYIFEEFKNDQHIRQFFPESNYKEIWTGSYPLSAIGVLDKSLVKDNVMIVGDAAGFVSPISGEGIHPSIVSGEIAAEAAIQALQTKEISRRTLRYYKNHTYIKKIVRNFKLKRSMVDFFYEKNGKNLD